MSDTVIPFRRRVQVTRRIGTLRSSVADSSPQRSSPVRIDRSVRINQLMLGLQAAGLSFKREESTGIYVIAPQ